jgi:hypothetical protein
VAHLSSPRIGPGSSGPASGRSALTVAWRQDALAYRDIRMSLYPHCTPRPRPL